MTRRDLLAAGITSAAVLPFGRAIGLKPKYDLVIFNARVIDPETGLDEIRNVGVSRGRIQAVTRREISGKKNVDGTDLVLAPGFIDPISHGQDLENDRIQVFDGVTTKLQMEVGVEDVAGWYKSQTGNRIQNFGAGTGHGWARRHVLKGEKAEEEGVATDADIAAMAVRIDSQLAAGGLGVGFGLEYMPASTRWEVIEMFRVAGKYQASCHCHIRYGTLLEEQSVLTAIEEVMTASMVTGAPLHIVHVPSMALSNTARALKLIEAAQRKGFNVTCDFYPYTAFGTSIGSEVFAPGWQQKFGIDYGDLEWGKTHERLTKETFEKYRAEDGFVVAHAIPETAVHAALQSAATMVGTDGGLEKGVGHPRSAGTYARILGKYVRDEKLLSLPTAIKKMSYMPARRFEHRCPAFKMKGRIQVGADADLVLFDPKKVIDRATFDKPNLPSSGFHHVWIGGEAVVQYTQLVDGRFPGRGLRAK